MIIHRIELDDSGHIRAIEFESATEEQVVKFFAQHGFNVNRWAAMKVTPIPEPPTKLDPSMFPTTKSDHK